jgi:hypothetical protein
LSRSAATRSLLTMVKAGPAHEAHPSRIKSRRCDMAHSVGDIMLYCAIAGAALFLVTLAFVSIEESVRRR